MTIIARFSAPHSPSPRGQQNQITKRPSKGAIVSHNTTHVPSAPNAGSNSSENLKSPIPSAPSTPMEMATENVNRMLASMISISDKVSDLILSPGKPPQVELNSRLTPVQIPGLEVLKPAHIETMVKV